MILCINHLFLPSINKRKMGSVPCLEFRVSELFLVEDQVDCDDKKKLKMWKTLLVFIKLQLNTKYHSKIGGGQKKKTPNKPKFSWKEASLPY